MKDLFGRGIVVIGILIVLLGTFIAFSAANAKSNMMEEPDEDLSWEEKLEFAQEAEFEDTIHMPIIMVGITFVLVGIFHRLK